MIFDTHAHYNDEAFNEDRDELLSSMPQKNVGLIMNACSKLSEMNDIIDMCDKYPFVYGAVGIHPEEVETASDGYLLEIEKYTKHPKILAIGEIGLDYYWTTDTKDAQKWIFREQIRLARRLGLPVIIHDREAHGDTMQILREENISECGGVFHCYSGSAEMVKEITEKFNMYVAFGGSLTFKNAVKPREAAKAVPLDRLLVETDCPYMAPVPFRGKRNCSAYIDKVLLTLSDIFDIPAPELEQITFENGKRLFRIED